MDTGHYVTKTSAVKHIMTTHLYMLNKKDLLTKAQMMFDEFNIRHLPVMEGDKVVGMLSNTDILRISPEEITPNKNAKKLFGSLKLDDVMRKNPHTVHENDSIEKVAKKLLDQKFPALPVMDDEGIIGIITTTDVIDFFLEGVNSEFNTTKNL